MHDQDHADRYACVCRPIQWVDRGPAASTLTDVHCAELWTSNTTAYSTLVNAHRYTLTSVTIPRTTHLQQQHQVGRRPNELTSTLQTILSQSNRKF